MSLTAFWLCFLLEENIRFSESGPSGYPELWGPFVALGELQFCRHRHQGKKCVQPTCSTAPRPKGCGRCHLKLYLGAKENIKVVSAKQFSLPSLQCCWATTAVACHFPPNCHSNLGNLMWCSSVFASMENVVRMLLTKSTLLCHHWKKERKGKRKGRGKSQWQKFCCIFWIFSC